jgi:hypothetical protein
MTGPLYVIRQAMGDPASWSADLFDYWEIQCDLARMRLAEICMQFPDIPVPPEVAYLVVSMRERA